MSKSRFFDVLVFLYFLTSSAEQLHIKVFLFKPKVGHLIALFLFGVIFFASRLKQLDRRVSWGLLGLWGSMTLSILFSPLPLRSLGYLGVGIFTCLMYFVLPISLMHLMDPIRLTRIYFASFLTVGTHAALQVFFSCFQLYDPMLLQDPIFGVLSRGQSWTYEPSFYALYAVPFVCFINVRFLLGLTSLKKLVIYNSLLLVSIATSAFVAYLFFVLTIGGMQLFPFCRRIFPRLWRRFLVFLCGFSVCFAGISLVFRDLFIATYYKCFGFAFFEMASFADRWQGIVAAWNVFLDYPFFGIGLGGVAPFLYAQEHASSAPIVLHHPTLSLMEAYEPTNAFTEMLASLGLCGGVILLVWSVSLFRLAIRAIKKADTSSQQMILPWLISSIVMLLCLQINQGLFRSYVWMHLGLAVGYAMHFSQILSACRADP